MWSVRRCIDWYWKEFGSLQVGNDDVRNILCHHTDQFFYRQYLSPCLHVCQCTFRQKGVVLRESSSSIPKLSFDGELISWSDPRKVGKLSGCWRIAKPCALSFLVRREWVFANCASEQYRINFAKTSRMTLLKSASLCWHFFYFLSKKCTFPSACRPYTNRSLL